MTDVRNTGKLLKTRRWEVYEELVPTIGDSDAAEEYPFENGIQLFSAGLVIGYMNEDDDLLQEFIDDGEIPIEDDEDSSYEDLTDFQNLLENNEEYAYTIELIDRFIAIELASRNDVDEGDDGSEEESQDQDELPEDVWDLVVAHADRGVGIIRQQWKNDNMIDLGDRFDELEDFSGEKINDISDQLTQIPNAGDQGRLHSGD
jgi:hypothetical protein